MQELPRTKLHELLEFPCDFTYKVIGEAKPELMQLVLDTVQQYVPGDYAPTINTSKTGKYNSINITIKAKNIEQVETLYHQLGKIDIVKMVL